MTIRECGRLIHARQPQGTTATTDFCCATMSNDVRLPRSSKEFVIYIYTLFVLDCCFRWAPCALASVACSLRSKFWILNIIHAKTNKSAYYKSFSCSHLIFSRNPSRTKFRHSEALRFSHLVSTLKTFADRQCGRFWYYDPYEFFHSQNV